MKKKKKYKKKKKNTKKKKKKKKYKIQKKKKKKKKIFQNECRLLNLPRILDINHVILNYICITENAFRGKREKIIMIIATSVKLIIKSLTVIHLAEWGK